VYPKAHLGRFRIFIDNEDGSSAIGYRTHYYFEINLRFVQFSKIIRNILEVHVSIMSLGVKLESGKLFLWSGYSIRALEM